MLNRPASYSYELTSNQYMNFQNLKGPQSKEGGMETMVYIAGSVERKRMTSSMAM